MCLVCAIRLLVSCNVSTEDIQLASVILGWITFADFMKTYMVSVFLSRKCRFQNNFVMFFSLIDFPSTTNLVIWKDYQHWYSGDSWGNTLVPLVDNLNPFSYSVDKKTVLFNRFFIWEERQEPFCIQFNTQL